MPHLRFALEDEKVDLSLTTKPLKITIWRGDILSISRKGRPTSNEIFKSWFIPSKHSKGNGCKTVKVVWQTAFDQTPGKKGSACSPTPVQGLQSTKVLFKGLDEWACKAVGQRGREEGSRNWLAVVKVWDMFEMV
jgi:hypothetical protein